MADSGQKMQRVAVLGANGQLGHDLISTFNHKRDTYEVTPLTHHGIEVTEHEVTRKTIEKLKPDIVINTTAYHQVDACEDYPEKSFSVNANAVRNIAEICRDINATFVHMSTDYVFGGELHRKTPYSEDNSPFPINVYGVSKLAGEYFVRSVCPKHVVVRSSGLFGVAGSSGKGGNFVETMLRLAKTGKEIRVVNDQRLSPTFTADLASKIIELISTETFGVFHIANSGDCTWYEFAQKIFNLTKLSPGLQPTTTTEFGAKATRPGYSVLHSDRLPEIGLKPLRFWYEALHFYLKAKSHI